MQGTRDIRVPFFWLFKFLISESQRVAFTILRCIFVLVHICMYLSLLLEHTTHFTPIHPIANANLYLNYLLPVTSNYIKFYQVT